MGGARHRPRPPARRARRRVRRGGRGVPSSGRARRALSGPDGRTARLALARPRAGPVPDVQGPPHRRPRSTSSRSPSRGFRRTRAARGAGASAPRRQGRWPTWACCSCRRCSGAGRLVWRHAHRLSPFRPRPETRPRRVPAGDVAARAAPPLLRRLARHRQLHRRADVAARPALCLDGVVRPSPADPERLRWPHLGPSHLAHLGCRFVILATDPEMPHGAARTAFDALFEVGIWLRLSYEAIVALSAHRLAASATRP